MITDHNTDNNFVVVLCIYMAFIYSIRYTYTYLYYIYYMYVFVYLILYI